MCIVTLTIMTTSNSAIHDIRSTIGGIQPIDDLEKTHLEDARAWLEATDDVFRRQKPDIPPKHLVSYFAVYDQRNNSLLLCDHIKAQLWLPPGGHVEPNESPTATVIRECKEELGLPAHFLNNSEPLFLTVTETVGLTPGHVDVSLWYVISGNILDRIIFDQNEFNDIEWWSLDEILSTDKSIFDPHMHRFIHKLLQSQRQ